MNKLSSHQGSQNDDYIKLKVNHFVINYGISSNMDIL